MARRKLPTRRIKHGPVRWVENGPGTDAWHKVKISLRDQEREARGPDRVEPPALPLAVDEFIRRG